MKNENAKIEKPRRLRRHLNASGIVETITGCFNRLEDPVPGDTAMRERLDLGDPPSPKPLSGVAADWLDSSGRTGAASGQIEFLFPAAPAPNR